MNIQHFIQENRVSRDPWSSDYDSAMQLVEDKSVENVNPFIEVSTRSDWKGIDVPVVKTWQEGPLFFIDGIRNMHMRISVQNQTRSHYAGFGSIAVGAITIEPGKMTQLNQALVKHIIRRYCIVAGLDEGFMGEFPILGIPGRFQGASAAKNEPGIPIEELQVLMRDQESQLAQFLAQEYQRTIIVDGPIRGEHRLKNKTPLIGYIKTLHTQYLPEELQPILKELKAGQRTPLFDIGSNRVSWYLRMAKSAEIDMPLSGIIRLEMRHIPKVKDIVTKVSGLLPTLATTPIKDPRAPQNLFPVHALENNLRRYMGNQSIIKRCLTQFLFQQDDRRERF